MATTSTTSQTKCRRFMSLEAWEALQERDREYTLNLAIAGPWIDEDNKERDNYGNLDARYGSERCQETALICTIAISKIANYLDQNDIRELAISLVHQYRAVHKNDKRWMDIYELKDISITNPQGYNTLKQKIFDSMDAKLVSYLGWSRTINSFSVLTRNEQGIALKYRRARDVLVATTQTQKENGMGECHDMDYPLRVLYSQLNFDLMEDMAIDILPEDIEATPFNDTPRKCSTIEEQLREVYHFSAKYKIVAGQYRIKIGLFSASFEILLRAAWKHNIPITICMPRLRYQTVDKSTQYCLTSAPVLTYLPSRVMKGRYELADNEYLRKHGLDKKASWRMSGFSMYNGQLSDQKSSQAPDQHFLHGLKHSDIVQLLSLFGFAHIEYPEGSKDDLKAGKYTTIDLLQAVCSETNESESGSDANNDEWNFDSGYSVNDHTSLLSLYATSTAIARKSDLSNTFIARQRDTTANTSYTMQAKPIPYTFNHIEVSTHAHEQSYWTQMLEKHSQGGPTYQHIFLVGNEAYSTSQQTTADTLMKTGNDALKIKTLLEAHPQHKAFVRSDHLEKYLRNVKTATPVPVLKKKIISAEENARRAEKNREMKARRLEKASLAKGKEDARKTPSGSSVQSCAAVVSSCGSEALIPIDVPRLVGA